MPILSLPMHQSGITGLGNEAITPTGAITVAQANALNALTTGVITATISDGTMALLTGLTLNLDSNGAQVVAANGNPVQNAYTITPTDTSASAADITTLIGTTSVNVNATNKAVTGTLWLN